MIKKEFHINKINHFHIKEKFPNKFDDKGFKTIIQTNINFENIPDSHFKLQLK